MAPDPESPAPPTDPLADIQRQIADLKQIVSGGARPDGAGAEARYGQSLFWLISHLSDGVHTLNNFMQVLIARIELVGSNLDRNEETNRAILQATSELKAISGDIERRSNEIAKTVGAVVREKPFLLRDIPHEPTEIPEILLWTVTMGEAVYFSVGSDPLLSSALFAALSRINTNPAFWATICGLLSIYSISAWATRKSTARRLAATGNFIYFIVTGGITFWFYPGVIGNLHHMVFAGLAFWMVWRGASSAL
jgi:hypothetical protein